MRANDTYVDGICDYEHQRTKQPQGTECPSLLDQTMAEARKCLFAPVAVTGNDQGQTITVFEAFVDALTSAAARGDANAIAELDLLEQHQQRQRDLAASKLGYANSPVRALEAKHKPIADLGRILASYIYAQMAPCVLRAFREVYGPVSPSSSVMPSYIDKAVVERVSRQIQRRAHKARGTVDYAVGYCKPPVSERFTSERNPRRQAKPADVWTKLELSRNKPVVMTSSNGRTTTTTRRAVAYVQLFRDAIRGKRRARAETRKIIIQLDQRGMLSAPDRPRRARCKLKAMPIEQEILLKAIEIKIAPTVKRDMVDRFTRQFGPVPDFVTAYERQLAVVHDAEGWSAVEAWIGECVAKKAAQDATEPGKPVAGVEAPPAVPTRPRTRASPPSRAGGDATAQLAPTPSASPKRRRAKATPIKAATPVAPRGKPRR